MGKFAAWLSATSLSRAFHGHDWLVPWIQIVHILAISVVLSSVGVIVLRIFGVAGTRTSVRDTGRRYIPWIWGALAVLLLSGSTLIIIEPARSLTNPAFGAKMAMLAINLAVLVTFQISTGRELRIWKTASDHGLTAKSVAIISLLLWFAVAVAGRWIAYLYTPT
jgi:hypothetical protein